MMIVFTSLSTIYFSLKAMNSITAHDKAPEAVVFTLATAFGSLCLMQFLGWLP